MAPDDSVLPLYTADGFRKHFLDGRENPVPAGVAVEAAVHAIVEGVRTEGDDALRRFTERFDRVSLDRFELDPELRRRSAREIDKETAAAVDAAAAEIEDYHRRQLREAGGDGKASRPGSPGGVGEDRLRIRPIQRVGLYVPGGAAAYPSSVLMAGIPARVAGVRELFLCTPPSSGGIPNPSVLYAAERVGVDRVFTVGGAQAVAALAFGTESIPKVDKIVGPGNAYVTAAKRLVFGFVAIDSLAGPTEIAVLADSEADPAFLAADLIAQAEHGPDSASVLFSADEEVLAEVRREVDRQLSRSPRSDIVRRALRDYGGAVKAGSWEEACDLLDRLAPEHAYLWMRDAEAWIDRIDHAGAIFFGPWAPVALGDYAAGPSHVLPTGGTARYFSQLTVFEFLRYQALYRGSEESFRRLAPVGVRLAENEGLPGHAESLRMRLETDRPGTVGRERS